MVVLWWRINKLNKVLELKELNVIIIVVIWILIILIVDVKYLLKISDKIDSVNIKILNVMMMLKIIICFFFIM